jgi:hypothetical protein
MPPERYIREKRIDAVDFVDEKKYFKISSGSESTAKFLSGCSAADLLPVHFFAGEASFSGKPGADSTDGLGQLEPLFL